MTTRLLLIRQATSAPNLELPEPHWPLSQKGEQQALDLARDLSPREITTIYSSPYLRALDTVTPLAQALELTIGVEEDLRERKLTRGPGDDWRQALERSWKDFNFALSGCESSNDCQGRVHTCVTRLAGGHEGDTIALSSHGNAIALFLNSIDPSFGYARWLAMKNPDVFELEFTGGVWHWAE